MGLVSGIFSYLPHAGIGALSLEPTMMGVTAISRVLPNLPASVVYVASGLILASISKALLQTKLLSGVAKPLAKLTGATKVSDFAAAVAVAIAASAGGVAYYKFRTGTDVPAETETGMLAMSGIADMGGLIAAGVSAPVNAAAAFSGLAMSGHGHSHMHGMHSHYAGPQYQVISG